MNIRHIFLMGAVGIGACSDDHTHSMDAATTDPICNLIMSRCHAVDTGAGPAHDCHEMADRNNAAMCAARQAECFMACPANPQTDAGVRETSVTDVSMTSDGGGNAVEVRFRAMVGAMPFACGTSYTNIGRSMATWRPLDFRLYVSNVRLVTDGGAEVAIALTQDGTWQQDSLALLDFENRTGECTASGTTQTNTSVRGTAPAGTYTGVRFTLGVPFSMNHGNAATAPSPLNLSAMFWAWNAGYKFLKIDGHTTLPSFNIHIGSTGCMGNGAGMVSSCSAPNRAEISLTGFDPTRNVVIADLAALLQNVDINTSTGAPGCMSSPDDPECAPIFRTLGLTAGTPSGTQSFFRVE
jgi:uncharacterized repeat protein (TIGR04052 family)